MQPYRSPILYQTMQSLPGPRHCLPAIASVFMPCPHCLETLGFRLLCCALALLAWVLLGSQSACHHIRMLRSPNNFNRASELSASWKGLHCLRAVACASMAPKRKAALAAKTEEAAAVKKTRAPKKAQTEKVVPAAANSDGRKLSLIIEAW